MKYPTVEWKRIKGMRDIISRHYFDIAAEAVYDVCDKGIGKYFVVLDALVEFEKKNIQME